MYICINNGQTHEMLPVLLQNCAFFVIFLPWDFKQNDVTLCQPGKCFIENKIRFVRVNVFVEVSVLEINI